MTNHQDDRRIVRENPGPGERLPTEAEAIEAAGRIFAAADAACARMTAREQAEAAWSPTSRFSVEELEDRIRARRGMTPLDRTPAAGTPKGGDA